ncbi:MAG TPA: class IV adenylate cyclase [Chitinophagaceae bacterium]
MILNYEFKARVDDPDVMEARLQQLNPEFRGEDHQVDTYFNVPAGRLKLRKGNIEHALIHYQRSNEAGAKQSDVVLYPLQESETLRDILTRSLGVLTVVDKKRRIYFIENVKFHFDRVDRLGSFIEVEAIDRDGTIGIEKLKEQCRMYADFFELQPHTYIANSYSDLLLDIPAAAAQAAGQGKQQ